MSTYVVSPLKVIVDKILSHEPTLIVKLRGSSYLFNKYARGDVLQIGDIDFTLVARLTAVTWRALVISFDEGVGLRNRARILRAVENRTALYPDSVYELLDAAAEKEKIDGFRV